MLLVDALYPEGERRVGAVESAQAHVITAIDKLTNNIIVFNSILIVTTRT